MPPCADVLVVGAGPAALCLAGALARRGLRVEALAEREPDHPWTNTYGIWGQEVDACGMSHLLAHRWSDTVSWFGPEPTPHGQDYGLFDRSRLQAHWLAEAERAGLGWHRGRAVTIDHDDTGSRVGTATGDALRARLVIDASGHEPVFVRRPDDGPVAGQAAYGIVGRFSAAPVAPGRFVLMDYRSDHLSEAERRQPPTFLYAMDLGDGLHFVEETSLALAPAVPFAVLKDRLRRRLAHRGVRVEEIHEQEHCLFPMNPALPDRRQRVVGFGGAASMVHPASGYMVGSLLRRAPGLAEAIAAACTAAPAPGVLPGPALSRAAWDALWPGAMRRKHALYRFGLEKLMRFDEHQLQHFFATFFRLPPEQWQGFLTNTLTVPELVRAMAVLFAQAPGDVRWGLMEPRDRELGLLGKVLAPDAAGLRASAA
ncbi:lycopene beta cyclase [Synechococcus sp. CCY 9618]|uniref:lycopene beta cyclase n=1 Tax=Synechococcus sp. CCY 9618 TaxID=2815602 RepID=UPI001C23EE47|nr:lycopene cyclase family protein [Synechococcus sp. CCY 9618]